eukprot:scaffold12729_cov114-Isochrysis_galbana.AAC.1
MAYGYGLCVLQPAALLALGSHASCLTPHTPDKIFFKKKSLVETRDTLAAARRDTSSPLPTGHSPSPFPYFSHPLLLIQAVCSGGVVSELRALQQPGLVGVLGY